MADDTSLRDDTPAGLGPARGALERAVRRTVRRPASGAHLCDLCDEVVPTEHGHLLDTDRGEALCACTACALLFAEEAASLGRYRRIPHRRIRLGGVDPGVLGVPVGLAFFVRQDVASGGGVLAHYPSPLGATQWEIDAPAWAEVVRGCPVLADLAPEVEALLVNTVHGAGERWLVPIDDCFRLVALVRGEWRGMSGGSTVWPGIQRFFAGLTERR